MLANSDHRKILYIAGWGRSGSTIIDNILGQIDGFFSVGELAGVWERGNEVPCACEKPFKHCDVWMRIFETAFGDNPEKVDFGRMLRLTKHTDRLHHLFWLSSSLTRSVVGPMAGLPEYANLTGKLYQSIFAVAGAHVIVDSSKHPSYGYILELLGVADLYVLHLIRDSRATAYSWGRKKPDPTDPTGYMRQFSLTRCAAKWNFNHIACERLWNTRGKRYLRLKYEEFSRQPKAAVEKILQFLNESPGALPFESQRTIRLGRLHGIGGNPSRKSGLVDIEPDEEWRLKMHPRSRMTMTVLTSPWLLRYGYSLRKPVSA